MRPAFGSQDEIRSWLCGDEESFQVAYPEKKLVSGSVLVDTNVVVAHFRNDPDVTSYLVAASALYLPWVVLGELHYGACRARRREQRLALIRDFMRGVVLLLPDHVTAERYGQIKSELAELGKPIPDNDLWIAALARQYGLPLAQGMRTLHRCRY